jgi:hypothetical protein
MGFTLVENLYIQPTPAGCYYALSTAVKSPERLLLRALLHQDPTPALSLESLSAWSTLDDPEQALALLHRAQSLRWVQGFREPLQCPQQPLETLLPRLLHSFSNQGKALLADHQGFYLASSGFPHEVAEELSALSADLANLHERRVGLLQHNMGLNSSAFAIVDAAGNSRLGFWPLYIGEMRFVLVISGMPHLNHPDFVTLTWLLSRRYT